MKDEKLDYKRREEVGKYRVGGLRWELKREGIQGVKANSRSWSKGNWLD